MQRSPEAAAKRFRLLGLAPLAAFLLVFFVGALATNIEQSIVAPSGALVFVQYERILTDPYYLGVIGFRRDHDCFLRVPWLPAWICRGAIRGRR
jgi:ABC-type spermidine/putrescine transport system permease subunit I